jgi:hypothetical protein
MQTLHKELPMTALLLAVLAFWPPWISIETPVNPFDANVRGAVFLVHAQVRDHVPQLSDVTASAEGIVNGSRQTITVRLDATSQPGVFAVRKQWPSEGTWLVCVTLLKETSAIVTLAPDGTVASTHIPMDSKDTRLARAATPQMIDSTLAALSSARGR